MDFDTTHPAISDLRRAARRRIPGFVFEYLDSATGDREIGVQTTRAALDAIHLLPGILHGQITPELETPLLGQTYARPFGIAPVGMSGLIWPDAERLLAAEAATARIPYGLSTVATQTPERVGPVAGEMGWFQLYPPADPGIRDDIMARARASGFGTLVLTVDVPADSRRERQRRANLTIPPKITPRMIFQMILHPTWALGMARHGTPSLKLAESYVEKTGAASYMAHAGKAIRGAPDWAYLDAVRAGWDGPLVVKGVLRPEDAVRLRAAGVDAIWVSDHSARQFEGGPGAITQLPAIRRAVGPDCPVIYDSGIEGGLDILRAVGLGADFVMLGRAWHFALAGLGPAGVRHLIHILTQDLVTNMQICGIAKLADFRDQLATHSYGVSGQA
ncbi:cytochrome containing L-lactate dehydrogenase [Dinoroseobacter shibae DFL 12 = DSM 16493]|jgi:L-lactate dehydrogenase (cytochrome)|uniref:Cytochrome containing L-lactate dehydrogenase n=1 Tax=Dinoroseobacter shibae (strain DSM 16493 / NCIMB 14021 / DFL 12) TaxID=398580 RepID=A8LSL9_DINSH|nr:MULTISPECIES: alpha-hydroxy acid oxidase [Dinoroseobacter]ABV94218.1 cytochrome containing L-lactate dehydrogenase [Dinoroseobacter shibae DFL 12 = DSM 16493]MDD9716265.1 alpha-hydroxy acid oxidase [Dinoroseobacter sp. PD6]URF45659.1 alpha-hydroxy-acid oxidizing protein [Dinoroseobacter shibae]URF49964.1 alpha-hydroxy-acid oxidizing protein [Dinoroseobacter shibae]